MNISKRRVQQQIIKLRTRKFFDPTYDVVFKKLFAKDATLIHFLNTVLRLKGRGRIKSIVRRKPSIKLTSKIGREEVRFDIHAKLGNGRYIDLEMQRASHDDFLCRVDLYASQLSINSKIAFDKSRPARDRKDHPYLMPQTYSIWICNFRVPFCKNYREELALFRLGDVGKSGALPVYDRKRYIIYDLTRYKPSGRQTSEDLWMEVFTQMAKAERAPEVKDKVILDVYSQMQVQESPEELVTEVATGMVTQAEISTRLGTARRAGHKAGLLQGRKEAAEVIANLQAASAAKDARIRELDAALAMSKAANCAYPKFSRILRLG